MTSNPNLVPSRNALRALRNLAFAHPTLFVGAVGSACCAAAVSCEVQRRIRIAEKVVATKRTLQSVSNGKRGNRVARMIEAAENGESFLLDPRSGQRRQRPRPRTYSTAVAERVEEDHDGHVSAAHAHAPAEEPPGAPEDLGALCTSDKRIPQTPSRHSRLGTIPMSDESTHFYKRPVRQTVALSPSGSRPPTGSDKAAGSISSLGGVTSRAWSLDSQRPHNSAAAEKVKTASMRSMKPADYRTYGRSRESNAKIDAAEALQPGNSTGPAAAQLGEAHSASIRERVETSRDQGHTVAPPELDSTPKDDRSLKQLRVDAEDGIDYGFEDAFSKSGADLMPFGVQSGSRPDLDEVQYRLSAQDATTVAPFDWQSPESDILDITANATQIPSMSPELSNVRVAGPYADPSDFREIGKGTAFELKTLSYFTHVHHANFGTTSTTPPSASEPGMSTPGVGRWSARSRDIKAMIDDGMLEGATRSYTNNYEPRRDGMLPSLGKMLLHILLSNESTQHLASDILFPLQHIPRGRGTPQERFFTRTHLYMREFCRLTPDLEQCKARASSIIRLAHSKGYDLHGKALESVVDAMCISGQAQNAEAWVQSLMSKYALARYIDLDKHIALGYARAHDWSAVNRVMQTLQEEEVPRTHPYWYSHLFEELLEIHLKRHTLDNSYDYLVNAMGYWSLVPTRNISCRLIAACIEAGDYEHLQQWIEAIRAIWPRLDIGTGSRPLAERISKIWQEKQVTCEHIERACSAMAWGAIEDPFSAYLRAIIMDNVMEDLRRHIARCNALNGRNTGPEGEATESFSTLVGRAETCLSQTAASQQKGSEMQAANHRLSCQLQAVWRLFEIVGGRISPDLAFTNEPMDSGDLIFLRPTGTAETGVVPPALRATNLPHMQELWPTIARYYVAENRHGRGISHAVLEHVIATMRNQGRIREAAELLDSLCQSPFVIGKMGKFLTIGLYEEYLKVAELIGDVKYMGRAMWAVLDASRDISLTPRMLLRAAVCVDSAKKHDVKSTRIQELDYLYNRMRKTRYIQKGMPEKPDHLPDWKSWDEQIRGGKLS